MRSWIWIKEKRPDEKQGLFYRFTCQIHGKLYGQAGKTHFQGRALFLNFITDVSPACDCYPYNDAPVVRDIGVVASTDPVAIDQASADLVNAEPALPGCCLTDHTEPGADKFKAVFPKIDWSYQLAYAERLKLGRRDYELIPV